MVAEVAFCGGEVEPVVFGEFGGDEASHGWFAFEAEYFPDTLENSTDFVGGFEGDGLGDGCDVVGLEEFVDPGPEVDDVVAFADYFEFSGTGSIEDARDEVGVADSPDEMGA